MIVEARDEDFAALLRGAAPGDFRLPEEPLESPEVLGMLRDLAGGIRPRFSPCAWLIVEDNEVVGLCSIVAPPTPGAIQIGYGVTSSRRRRGVATRAIAALAAWAAADPRVLALKAETSVHNGPSQRALERNGFEKTGDRSDPEDGDLFCWTLNVVS
jgi:RimJ/RimL family protein N-acetyltransferase